MNEAELSASGTFNEQTGKIEVDTNEDSYSKELKDLIAKKNNILKAKSKWLKGEIQVNYNTKTGAKETINTTDNSRTIKLGKKPNKENDSASINKNVS